MPAYDLNSETTVSLPIDRAALTEGVQSAVIDLGKDYGSATFIVFTGTITLDCDISLHESDETAGTYARVSADHIVGGSPTVVRPDDNDAIVIIGANDSDTQFKIGYVGGKQFIKIELEADDSTLGVMLVQGNAVRVPTATQSVV